MKPLMLEMIAGPTPVDEDLVREVSEYRPVDRIQTIHQMKWLAETVHRYGRNPHQEIRGGTSRNITNWLMLAVNRRKDDIRKGIKKPADFLIKGSVEFLGITKERSGWIFMLPAARMSLTS